MDSHTIDVSPVSVSCQVEKVDIQFVDFQLNATEGTVQVNRYTKNSRFVDSMAVTIPQDIYAKWGTDDTIIVDYVLQQLKMDRLNPPIIKKQDTSAKPHTAQKR